MKFTHHANRSNPDVTEWTFDASKTYDNTDEYRPKPVGLWLSVDDGWFDWCKSERPEWLKGPEFEFTVDRSRILVIDTIGKLEVFNEVYAKPHGTGFFRFFPESDELWPFNINWKPLTEKYAGIMFAPYFHQRRWTGFYEGIDCASACVWDLTAVTCVGRLPQRPVPKSRYEEEEVDITSLERGKIGDKENETPSVKES